VKFGLFGINFGPCAVPSTAVRVAQEAEAAGFESVWTGEHVVLPDPQVPPSPVPPETPFLDPAIALAWVAAHAKTIRLGTGIIIVPQRNPLVLAKELASVDLVSGGRLIFGLGIGYLRPEFDALGVSFTDKGARAMEYLEAMQAVWTQDEPSYAGRFASFSGIQSLPRPLQRPHPPIVIGGATPSAFRRAVRHANGWYGFALDREATGACIARLRSEEQRGERPPALGRLEISVTPRGRLSLDSARAFAALGVDRLIVYPPAPSEGDLVDFIRRSGDEVLRPMGC
jgi:probable F420-dependent oxidoreductase